MHPDTEAYTWIARDERGAARIAWADRKLAYCYKGTDVVSVPFPDESLSRAEIMAWALAVYRMGG